MVFLTSSSCLSPNESHSCSSHIFTSPLPCQIPLKCALFPILVTLVQKYLSLMGMTTLIGSWWLLKSVTIFFLLIWSPLLFSPQTECYLWNAYLTISYLGIKMLLGLHISIWTKSKLNILYVIVKCWKTIIKIFLKHFDDFTNSHKSSLNLF